ncbi:MAG: LysM peptidoglycan-binding domain-containing protein [Bacteriovoracia bacterium]
MSLTIMTTLLAFVTACGSSKKAEDELEAAVEDEIPVADAGTDAVPEETLENAAEAVESEVAAAEDRIPDMPPPVTEAPPVENPSAYSDSESEVASTPSYDGGSETYSVQSGDTLMKIAFEVYGDVYQWQKIYHLNQAKITNPNAIPRGTVLQIEKPATPVTISRNGEKYLIRQGDTLGTISNQVYGTPKQWRKIWENNRQLIKDPNRIYAGFYLYYVADGNSLATGGEETSVEPRAPAAESAPAQ